MFWGITLDGGKRYSQTVERPFHLSMAALECNSADRDKTRRVQVMIQHESAEFLLCTLCPFSLLQQQLDLTFSQGEEVTFFLNGIGVVHLTGSLLEEESEPVEDNFEDDESDLDIPQLQEIDDHKVNSENDSDSEPKPSGTKRKMNETITRTRKKKNKLMAEKEDKFDQHDQDFLFQKENSLGKPNIQERKKKKKKKKKKNITDTGETEVEVWRKEVAKDSFSML